MAASPQIGDSPLKRALEEIDLGTLLPRFQEQKIDHSMIQHLNDRELSQLGIQTIGDRSRLRQSLSRQQQTPSEPWSNTAETLPNASRMTREIASLFGPSRSRSTNRRRDRSALKQRTWTGKFFCLSDKTKERTPTSEEKMTLQKCGLGSKKIQFSVTDKEEDLYRIVNREYPLLNNCGGFELLRCSSNCRMLQVIEGNWDVENLKTLVGNQCTIYIRPIQRGIIMPANKAKENEIKEECSFCKKLVLLSKLRNHLDECEGSNSIDASETDLPDLPVFDTIAQNVPEMSVQWITDDAQVVIEETVNLQQAAAEEFIVQVENEVHDQESFNLVLNHSVLDIVRQTTEFATLNNIGNPVDILRRFQKEMITGRKLDIEDLADPLTGLTNFIMIDRSNCLQTALEEIGAIQDLRLCLEVQFFGEEAKDLGGPRKEFFAIVLQRIQEEYFSPVKEWSDDYETIGKIFALSTLQNGKLPRILSAELLTELFHSETPRKFVKDLRAGLDALGLYQLVHYLPTMKNLFTQQTIPLTFRMLAHLIKPRFSIDGSNQRMVENTTYQNFNKYLRETAAGRRHGVSLNHILRFVTGADEEPALGFSIEPSLHFVKFGSFLPTASTCANTLYLTVPTDDLPMPSTEDLFKYFDYAFLNSFFGFE